MNFERYAIYELRPDANLQFTYVVCLSSTEHNVRHEVKNISFLPLIKTGKHAERDPFRVPVQQPPRGEATIPFRMYIVIDAIQSIGKAAFLPGNRGRITVNEEKEVRQKLGDWLGFEVTEVY